MSEPTYLIRVEHDPADLTLPYSAKVYRLADESHAVTRWGSTAEEAVKAAQQWMQAVANPPEAPREFYASETGVIDAGESVRVLRQP